ncbi:MAG: cation diffusion facilitator family transporter [Candidatus Acidiferrales bacterium]
MQAAADTAKIHHMHDHAHGAHGSHSHTHDHAHAYAVSPTGRMTFVLGAAVVVTLILVAVEFVAGYFGHSISLVSDAVHNLTDVPAMFLSWLATRWAQKPPTQEHTYGFRRAGILAAFTNALFLAAVALFIVYEGFERLRAPVAVEAGVMLWVALFALLINGGITWALVAGRRDLNVRSILLHSFGDAISNVAIIVGAAVIHWIGAHWIDPVIGIAIGAMVLWSSVGILRESTHVLLEGLPRQIRLEDVAKAILKVEGAQEVHDIHIWTIGTDLQALSCHIRIPDMHMEDSERILALVQDTLEHEFHITHSTVQFERAGLPDTGLYMPEPIRKAD